MKREGGVEDPSRVYDLIVVGAGPAGSRVAAVMAATGWQVLLLEDHAAVGMPVHCTGIVSDECVTRYHLPSDLVLRQIDRFRVLAPDGSACNIPGDRNTVVLDRTALDRLLAGRAVAAGAVLETGARVLAVEPSPDGVRVLVRYDDGERWRLARTAVLACGAMSNLPVRSGLSAPTAWYRTVQGEWPADSASGAEVYLGSRYSRGSFGWTVPTVAGCVKAGLITPERAREGYDNLLALARHRIGLAQTPAGGCRPRYRRMPMGLVKTTVQGRVASVGDAAGQVKTTTGGGIFYALMCADLLAAALHRAWHGGRVAAHLLQAYDGAWKAAIGRDLQSGLVARRALEGLNDEELSRLVSMGQREEVQGLLSRHWQFDFHQGMLLALATSPGLRRLAAEACRSRGWDRLMRISGRFFQAPAAL